jgi:hypothetical protein
MAFDNFLLGIKTCHSIGAAAICLTETNTNWNQPYQLGKLSKAICNIWSTTSTQASQHPELFHSPNQRGGTLEIITDQWVSRVQAKGIDPYGLGRWSYITLAGKGNKKIILITAYRVCSATASRLHLSF